MWVPFCINPFKIPFHLKPPTFVFKPKLLGGVNHPPSSIEGSDSSIGSLSNDSRVPDLQQVSVEQTLNKIMDPKTLISFVPSYNGDAFTLYNYINCAKQWLSIAGGETPQNVMLLLSKLEGKAAITISMVDHDFQWFNIESILKQECGDNREFNTLLIELANVKKKTTYKDLIFELKQKLFFIKSKLLDKYTDKMLVEEVMEPYINTAQNTLWNSLPYHDQIYVSNCNFNETATKILQLEAEGRFDNIKQKFSNLLPPPRVINSYPQYSKPMYPQNNFNPQNTSYPKNTFNPQNKHTYPTTQHSFNQRFQMRPNFNYHKQSWHPNYNNNVFNKSQHPFFKQNQSKPMNRQNSNDVSMRTAPNVREGQINLGKGMVAEEVFHHDNYLENYNSKNTEQNFHERSDQNKDT